jgi:DNA-binding XRE family transcriptional regulator
VAEFTYLELKRARETRKIPRWQLANQLGVSEDTLERWENGKQDPHPDDVSNIEHALGAETEAIWHRWMLSNCESYRERYRRPSPTGFWPRCSASGTNWVTLLAMQERVERDAMDGQLDDPVLRASYLKEIDEAVAALTLMRAQLGRVD